MQTQLPQLSCSPALKQNLTFPQRQAYEGAKTFYYCFIPTAMLTILLGHLFVLQQWLKATKLVAAFGAFQLAITFVMILMSAVFYVLALKVYRRCNQVDTTPVFGNNQLSEELQEVQHLQEKENSLLGNQKPKRYECRKCNITCDYRTKHCRKCQVCIERFDHHCFWIGNCVGRHNHLPFYLFLFYQTANNTLNFILIYHLTDYLDALSVDLHITIKIMIVAMELLALGFIVFTGYLLIYHTMLVSNGLTTWEHMRRAKISYLKHLPPGYIPFSKGVIQNWKKFICQSTRHRGVQVVQNWDAFIPTFEESQRLPAVCNLIDNQYYSCC